jgi:hypothetical protein
MIVNAAINLITILMVVASLIYIHFYKVEDLAVSAAEISLAVINVDKLKTNAEKIKLNPLEKFKFEFQEVQLFRDVIGESEKIKQKECDLERNDLEIKILKSNEERQPKEDIEDKEQKVDKEQMIEN